MPRTLVLAMITSLMVGCSDQSDTSSSGGSKKTNPGARKKSGKQAHVAKLPPGWFSLFDGKTTRGWEVEGDVKVVNGALVLGNGKVQANCATLQAWPGYELAFEYRIEGKRATIHQYVYQYSGGAVRSGRGLNQFGPRTKWVECRSTVKFDPESGKATHQIKGGMGSGRGASNIPPEVKAFRLGFHVDKGSKLFLRNLRLKPMN